MNEELMKEILEEEISYTTFFSKKEKPWAWWLYSGILSWILWPNEEGHFGGGKRVSKIREIPGHVKLYLSDINPKETKSSILWWLQTYIMLQHDIQNHSQGHSIDDQTNSKWSHLWRTIWSSIQQENTWCCVSSLGGSSHDQKGKTKSLCFKIGFM